MQVARLELASRGWKPRVLPLNDTCSEPHAGVEPTISSIPRKRLAAEACAACLEIDRKRCTRLSASSRFSPLDAGGIEPPISGLQGRRHPDLAMRPRWIQRESNSRPLHCERSALPTEPWTHYVFSMVGDEGVEPSVSSASRRCPSARPTARCSGWDSNPRPEPYKDSALTTERTGARCRDLELNQGFPLYQSGVFPFDHRGFLLGRRIELLFSA